jgi:orotidine-5'-phosphate decarboxylase
MSNSPIILAVDTDDLSTAQKWVDELSPFLAAYKLGLEFFLKFGADGVRKIQSTTDLPLFLDLKLHDIPNTVAAATSQIADLKPKFLTVHASGGAEMISRAVAQVPDTAITAVTVLTSLSDSELPLLGFAQGALSTATALAHHATNAGARAIVCSPLEISSIRRVVPATVSIITPGVRPASMQGGDDQSRTMSPSDAIAAGANYLVIGRPITREWANGISAMSQAAQQILREIS